MEILYFAWVRERIGLPRERVDTQARTVAELVGELRAREARYEAAFEDLTAPTITRTNHEISTAGRRKIPTTRRMSTADTIV